MIALLLLGIAQSGAPPVHGLTEREASERLRAVVTAFAEPCQYTLRKRSVYRTFDSAEEFEKDELATNLSTALAKAVGSAELSAVASVLDLADVVCGDATTAEGWSSNVLTFEVVFSPGLEVQRSKRGDHAHTDLLSDVVWIASSAQSGQVEVRDGPPKVQSQSPAILISPLRIGKPGASWIGKQAWTWLPGKTGEWLRTSMEVPAAFAQWIRVRPSDGRPDRILSSYGPRDIVFSAQTYAEDADQGTPPRRSVRVVWTDRFLEIQESVISDFKKAPKDEAFQIVPPENAWLADKRASTGGSDVYRGSVLLWPSDLQSFFRTPVAERKPGDARQGQAKVSEE